jgi:hypothetical protein
MLAGKIKITPVSFFPQKIGLAKPAAFAEAQCYQIGRTFDIWSKMELWSYGAMELWSYGAMDLRS